MVLKTVLRLSWLCLLLCSSGFGYPFPQQVQTGAGGGATGGSGTGTPGTGSYFGGLGSSYYYGPGSYYNAGGAGSSAGSAGGAGSNTGGTGSGRGGAGSRGGGGGAASGSGTGGAGSGGVGSGSAGGAGSEGGENAGPGFPVFQGFPWSHQFVVVPPSFSFDQLRLPQFPLGNPWDTNEVPLGSIEVPPAPPSSHIVQTSKGYQRARSVLSHSKYSPDDWEMFPLPSGQDQDGGQVKGQEMY